MREWETLGRKAAKPMMAPLSTVPAMVRKMKTGLVKVVFIVSQTSERERPKSSRSASFSPAPLWASDFRSFLYFTAAATKPLLLYHKTLMYGALMLIYTRKFSWKTRHQRSDCKSSEARKQRADPPSFHPTWVGGFNCDPEVTSLRVSIYWKWCNMCAYLLIVVNQQNIDINVEEKSTENITERWSKSGKPRHYSCSNSFEKDKRLRP